MNKQTYPPVIIIGMHRSGTAMISRTLEKLGLFLGAQLDPNHEATFFLRLNEWMVRASGGSWDNPDAIDYLLSDRSHRQLCREYVEVWCRGPRVVSYMGLRNWLRYKALPQMEFCWGWKDPRNTLTLPLWLEVFPQAKVIHVCRHGVDVANSLRTRHRRSLSAAKYKFDRYRWVYSLRRKKGGFSETMRCATLAGGFGLWEDYMARAQKNLATVDVEQVEVRYEAFVRDPVRHLADLAKFCGLETDASTVRRAAMEAKVGREFAYKGSRDLIAFSKTMRSRLERFEYLETETST